MALQVIREEILKKMEESVEEFVQQTRVKCAMVADKSGQLITQVGFTASLDLRSLAALVSGIFVSGEELAKILGESHFVVLYHEGRKMSIFFSLIGLDYIFVAIFDDRTNMGVVQLYSNEVKEILAPVLEEEERAATAALGMASSSETSMSGEGLLNDEELDGFFQQGLDDEDDLSLYSLAEEEETGEEESPLAAVDLDSEEEQPAEEERDELAAFMESGLDAEEAEEVPQEEGSAQEEEAVVDSLDDLFHFDSEEDQATGDELSRLFDDITMEEAPSDEGEKDVESLRDGLDDLFNL